LKEIGKLGKGIVEQIKDSKSTHYDGKLSLKDIDEFFQHIQEGETQLRKELVKQQKETSKHLAKRSKELGKEIPVELLLMTNPFLNRGTLVSQEFMIRYKEWF